MNKIADGQSERTVGNGSKREVTAPQSSALGETVKRNGVVFTATEKLRITQEAQKLRRI